MTQHWLQAWWTAPRVRHLLLEAVIAFCLAFMVWLYIHGRAQESLDHVQIPVHIQLAVGQRDQYLLDIPGSPRVTASFVGPSSRIRDLRRKLQRGQIKAAVDYVVAEGRQHDASFHDKLRIEPSQLLTPPGVTVELIEESCVIPVTVHRLAERALPVKLEHTGDARVTQLKIEPATVLVRGPKTLIDRAQALGTLPYAFAATTDEMSDAVVKGQVALATEIDGRPVQVTSQEVAFRCKLVPKKRIYELHEVPVHFLCPMQFPWRPRFAEERLGKVTVRLIGPAGEELPPVLAYVDLTKGTFGRGRNLEPLRLQLPKDFQLADNTPPLIAFHLEEMDRAATVEVEKP